MKSHSLQINFSQLIACFCILLLAACQRADTAQYKTEVIQIELEELHRIGDESKGDTILFGSITQIDTNQRGDILVSEMPTI